MIPRDYQHESLDAIAAALAADVWSQMLVLPTGGGKTVVFALLRAKLNAWLQGVPWIAQRMLIIAHRDELLQQAREKLIAANPDLAVEIEQGDAEATPMAEVVIASIQTLAARSCARLRRLGPDRFRIVVVDEAHHAAAESYQSVLRELGVLPPLDLIPKARDRMALHAARVKVQQWWSATRPGKLLLGVTATPNRSDAIGLEWTFRQVVYQKTLRWMIEAGYLVPPRGFVVETGLSLDTVKTIGGDFQQKGLAAIVNTRARNEAIAAAWQEHAADRSTIVFGVDVQHAKDLAAAFEARGVRALSVDGSASTDERRAALSAFADGSLRVLTNCALFTEGFDEPRIGCVVLARPTQSQTLYSQMVGRGLRLFDGKADCVVLDGVDNSQRHSLVSLGDLFGLPPRFNLQGQDAVAAAQKIESLIERFSTLDVSGARSLAELDARVRSIDLFTPRQSGLVTEHASMRWITESDSRFHIVLPQDEAHTVARLVIRQGTLGDWDAVVQQHGVGDYRIASCDDVRDAFQSAERWIAAHRPDVAMLNDKDAAWRTRPPMVKQIIRLQEWGCERIPRTRGEASEMIDAYLQNRGRR